MIKLSEESDGDFWVDFERNTPTGKKKPQQSEDILSTLQILLDKKDEKIPESGWLHYFYQEKLTRVRESKEVEISVSQIRVQNQAKRTFSSTIEALENRYKRDTYQLQNDLLAFRDVVMAKDNYITSLHNLISEIGLFFSESTIKSITEKPPLVKPKENKDFKAMVQELQNQKIQISQLKEICHLYQQDADEANRKSQFFQQEFRNLEISHKKEVEKMKESFSELLKLHEKEKQDLQKSFNEKTAEFIKEIEALDMIQVRHQDYIHQLQEELKNAKIVIQNRTIRNMCFEKLQDYKEEIEKIGLKNLVPVPPQEKRPASRTKASTRSFGENQLTKSSAKRSGSLKSSQNFPIFTRKVCTSKSNIMELRPHSVTPGL